METLTIKNLTKVFDDQKAVNNVSFSLQKGEILAILGESGSGKTTLLHLIAALHEPTAGTLLLEGKKITPPSKKLISGHSEIKLVRQDYGLFPNMTIRENIAYELRYYEEKYRNKRIDKLLKISGIQKVQHHLPRQVSGGEQQRAVIAKAIAEEPTLLLLDEPFSHLDTLNKQRLKAEILQIIKEEQVSCLFVTHDVVDAYALADRMIVMQKGKILQIDEPQAIYENPKNEYIATITGNINLFSADIFSKNFPQFSDVSSSKNIVIRYEKIKIINENGIKARVEKCIFLGSFYEIWANVSNEIVLKFYSFDKLLINQEINLQITDYKCFN